MNIRKLRAAAVAAAVAVAAGIVAAPGQSGAETNKLRIWADADRKSAVESVVSSWATANGVTVEVIQKDFGKIRDDLKTVDPSVAPDVIVGAHDWVGELSANGSVVPLTVSSTVKSKIPTYALDAFSYANASGTKVLYGAPVALENVGLVVNTKVAKVPTTFKALVDNALAFQKKKKGNFGVVVPGGDAYHYYPFFSGLCGYIFGKDSKGNLNPKNVGVANSKLLANAGQVTNWNKVGFLSSKINYDIAKNAFLAGKAAYWITGPWESDTIAKSGLKTTIIQVPKNNCASVPFLGVQGFMVTKFAAGHGLETKAKDLVGSHMLTKSAQLALAAANGRAPANTDAAKSVSNPILKQFAAAGVGGVPMPNIPEMSSVWGDLASAWTKTLQGAGAAPARTAFSVASKRIVSKIKAG